MNFFGEFHFADVELFCYLRFAFYLTINNLLHYANSYNGTSENEVEVNDSAVLQGPGHWLVILTNVHECAPCLDCCMVYGYFGHL